MKQRLMILAVAAAIGGSAVAAEARDIAKGTPLRSVASKVKSTPRDVASGHATGKRMHQPRKIFFQAGPSQRLAPKVTQSAMMPVQKLKTKTKSNQSND